MISPLQCFLVISEIPQLLLGAELLEKALHSDECLGSEGALQLMQARRTQKPLSNKAVVETFMQAYESGGFLLSASSIPGNFSKYWFPINVSASLVSSMLPQGIFNPGNGKLPKIHDSSGVAWLPTNQPLVLCAYAIDAATRTKYRPESCGPSILFPHTSGACSFHASKLTEHLPLRPLDNSIRLQLAQCYFQTLQDVKIAEEALWTSMFQLPKVEWENFTRSNPIVAYNEVGVNLATALNGPDALFWAHRGGFRNVNPDTDVAACCLALAYCGKKEPRPVFELANQLVSEYDAGFPTVTYGEISDWSSVNNRGGYNASEMMREMNVGSLCRHDCSSHEKECIGLAAAEWIHRTV